MSRKALILLAAVIMCIGCQKAGEWTPLFDGKTLTGWEVHSGSAIYDVEDGEIVGTNFEKKYIAQGRPFYSLARMKID